MKTKYTNILKTSVVSTIAALMLSSTSVSADCTYELFNISSKKGTKIVDFIDQLSDECEFSVVISDTQAEKILKSRLNKTHIKNLTINEVLDLILKQNNLTYSLENNLLKISYLNTRVFNIDYILSQRKGTGSTDVTLSSSGGSGNADTTTSSSTTTQSDTVTQTNPSTANSGISIESSDEVVFWERLDKELEHVLNRPEDKYKAVSPIINKNAGLITVTATQTQLDRLDKYLKKLQDKVKLQVLIDVQLLSVTMTKSNSTGIDWSQLYKLQNGTLGLSYLSKSNVTEWTGAGQGSSITAIGTQAKNAAHMLNVQVGGSIDEIIKFLKTQGNVSSISNPKVLTLNNQPALVTAGTEYFYKILQSTSTTTQATTTAQNEEVSSVFAGILLDITPEISDNDMITLKINPSISETTTDMSNTTSANRTTPPDLNRRQLSSVVTVKDGNRIILGGLIHTSTSKGDNRVPILGDIPGLNYLFKREENKKQIEELVIVIEPHIIRNDKSQLSLSDLGYEGISDSILKSNVTSADLEKEEKDKKTTKKAETQDDK
ncbi:pilus (MSHA type) biogenesis protein MshL [Sulfurimonas sp. HSL3-2]|uniref:pilus (MSHA type) biogenesis protein MshL n=1 Tax=Hydrocurvibacter mobilis TaxID=3131936 RepID=UPI0031F7657F